MVGCEWIMGMKRKAHDDMPVDHNPVVRLIDGFVSAFLFSTLFVLSFIIFRKVFGTSDIAWIVGLITCFPLASVAYALVDKAFSALMSLLFFALPTVLVVLAFLMI